MNARLQPEYNQGEILLLNEIKKNNFAISLSSSFIFMYIIKFITITTIITVMEITEIIGITSNNINKNNDNNNYYHYDSNFQDNITYLAFALLAKSRPPRGARVRLRKLCTHEALVPPEWRAQMSPTFDHTHTDTAHTYTHKHSHMHKLVHIYMLITHPHVHKLTHKLHK